MATGARDVHRMFGDLDRLRAAEGLRNKQENLQLWCNFVGNPLRIGGRALKVDASMVFLGALLCKDRQGAVVNKVALAWTKLWTMKRQVATRALSPKARL